MHHFKCLCVWTVSATLWTFLGVRVGQDYESQTDFSRYISFGWAVVPQEKAGASLWGSPFTTKRIHAAVKNFMVQNGYIYVAESGEVGSTADITGQISCFFRQNVLLVY
jgi:hypothetical protein